MKLFKWFTKHYESRDLYDRRKAEYSKGFVIILTLSTIILTIIKAVTGNLIPVEMWITIVNVSLLLFTLVIIYRGNLVVGVWTLCVLGIVRVVTVYMLYDVVEYYVVAAMGLTANGFIHVRKSQYYFVNISVAFSAVYNALIQWHGYFQETVSFDAALMSIVSIFYLLAILYMIKTFVQNTDEEIRMANELHSLAHKDQLTSAFNRRKLDKDLEIDLLLSENGVLMVDFDHFKSINDENGHSAGDTVLRDTIEIIHSMIRSDDIVVRYGGEEFVVILRNCGKEQIEIIAEKIRRRVDDHIFEEIDRQSVTISVGGTAMKKNEGIHDAIDRADKALYKAKENGRNTVVVL